VPPVSSSSRKAPPEERQPERARTVVLRDAEHRLLALLAGGPATRAHLAAAAELPLTTTTSAVARLRQRRLVMELPSPPTGSRGRPAALVAVVPPRGLVAVLRLSRRCVAVSLVTLEGEVRAVRCAGFAAFDGAADERALPALARRLLDQVLEPLAPVAVPEPVVAGVVSMPYPVTAAGAVATVGGHLLSPRVGVPAPTWALDGAAAGWEERLGIPVVVENDASLAALGETVGGAAAGALGAVCLRVRDGLGAGVVVDGRVVRGRTGLAGEVAHLRVGLDGPVCGCGGRGCLVGLPTTARAVAALEEDAPTDGALEDVRRLGTRLGSWVVDACLAADPEVVVVDGPPGSGLQVLVRSVRAAVEAGAPAPVVAGVRVVPSALGDDAVVRGAAATARRLLAAGARAQG